MVSTAIHEQEEPMRTTILRLNAISISILALCLAASACGGWETGLDEEGQFTGTDQDSQALVLHRPSFPGDQELAAPDLVGEILSCGYDTVEVAIRNEGNIATDAETCYPIGPWVLCFDSFEVDVYTLDRVRTFSVYDLEPGEEEIRVLPKPAGWEGRVWIDVDTYGGGDHSVNESNEDNNYSQTFCVM
jgi:hypothetical protein